MKDSFKKMLIWGAAGTVTAGAVATAGAALAAGAAIRKFTLADMRNRVVLITGGSRGLGFAIAQEFASLGARIVICARDQEELDRAAMELRKTGAKVLPVVCDVARQDEVNEMIRKATDHFGAIDVLVNNAGIISVGPLESQTIEDFREAMDVMFWSNVYTTLAVLPQMKERRSGWIANITSIGGKISVPHLVPYGCAKFAAVGFSEGTAAELAKDGIKVTTVVPGLMRTGSHLNAYFKGDHRKEFAWFSLGASSPLVSIGARRAARSIVRAVRRGQTEVTLSLPAKLAVKFHGLMPATTAYLLGIDNRLMPGTGNTSKERFRGRESQSAVSRSIINEPGRRAAREFLQEPFEGEVAG